ncbi:MAG TPA: carbon-nitrogen hydrolase family protein [Bacteroidales bacterium]|nr:carbon-nitrogen hydrolase family protein [Bacteroidales bacterium]
MKNPFYYLIKPHCYLLILLFTLVRINSIAQQDVSNAKNGSELKIAMLQMPSRSDKLWNMNKGDEYCRIAKSLNADIALFPEMVNFGYKSFDFKNPLAMQNWIGMGESRNGEFVKHFQQLAKELEMAIVITYLEKTDSLPKNSASLIDRHGHLIMTYSKVHTVDVYQMESAMSPGTDFYVTELDTKIGKVKVGIMICYDREFPESARILMLKGAELILTPNACGLDSLRLMQFQVRAWENAVISVMTNYARTEGDGFNGRSCAFSAEGSKIIIADDKEGVYIATFNMQDTRNYRSSSFWGNGYRRPHRYNELISPNVQEPFIRINGFGKEFKRLER